MLRNALGEDSESSPTNWIEQAIGRHKHVLYLNTPPGASASTTLLETEFWNPNISAVYNLGPGELCGLPETSPAIDVETGQVNAPGAEANDYAVVSKGFLFPLLLQLAGLLADDLDPH